MGITSLFAYIKKYVKKVDIREFSGRTGAVDASCWMHKSLAASLSTTGDRGG